MNWTLRRKILAGYAAALLLAGVVLVLALLNIARLGSASDAILQENYRSILAAEQMLNALQRQENAALLLLFGADAQPIVQFSKAEQQFLIWLDRAKNNITIEGEAEILQKIDTEYTQFLHDLVRLRQTYEKSADAGLTYYREELQPHADEVRDACTALHSLNRETMEAASARARRIAQTAVSSMVITGVLAFAAAAAASVWQANRIVRPIQQLTAVTEQVAAGEYSVSLRPESQDEVGRLAEKFNIMVTKLRTYHQLNIRHIIGEQKKAEAILNSIDDGVLVVDTARKVTSLNPAAARALGLPVAEARDRDLAQVISDSGLREAIERILESGEAPSPHEPENYLTIAGPGETQSHYEYTITPISGPDGTRIGAVVLLRNVTKLKELDRLKTQFVMTASHELRSPLTSIAMSIGLLRERVADKLSNADRELFDVAHEEVERLQVLVNELLDLSKIESGRIEMAFSEASIQAMLEAAVAPFSAQAQERGIKLTVEVEDDVPRVWADANKLAWVVTNLVGNALRYTRSLIEVSAEKAGPWVNIYVRDDGVGIPYEQQARIFDKFVQIEEDRRAGGAGLGLAIAKEIVRAHRGNIWVESEPGKGSLFIVALPIHRPATIGVET